MATKVWIIFYSTYGHVKTMAEAVKKGVESVEGVEATIYQVAETLPSEVLEKLHAPPKSDYPIIDPHTLTEADGFVFGFPTRFGMMAAQMKAFFDATGGLWQKGALHGKPASLFTSTASQGGGQETTLMTAVTQLAHHGMIYVPSGYAAGQGMFGVQEARGGSAWGAGCLAGPDGSRQPSEIELLQAEVVGKQLATAAKKLKA
ncbi:NAD(P)H dehydrogenase (quinone) fqr1 [Pleodorina starrii]|uniref:NAD(P)H dehydrogenase (quinone) n=1 Tax=Pleodorina starrii TaxID=330485 RepID=A0A9W6EXW7_9CHLO|nr:NAD(P)H dehydrogenase (quinone) fqr1 [Pleodorina starrii]GLC48451.1 NAD(P)H dehydrogenase (quinone) fqr1 [Pleodorina starrii]GLC71771.1 NAD(P)H dehydrogenase (quinone) fqr1 [Pleodorina starrii]